MFSYVDNFYEGEALGFVALHFLNEHFINSYQSQDYFFQGDRTNAYPVKETKNILGEHEKSIYHLLKNTFRKKTNLELLYLETKLRKIEKKELQNSSSFRQLRPHQDNKQFDIAGIIYFNGSKLKDGTYFFNTINDFEPTAIVAPKVNRCVFYSSEQPHCPSMEQSVEERWVQIFFGITKEETYKRYKESNGT